jgi:hypothetical protein
MIPGTGTPGRFAIGQISDALNASALGVLVEAQVLLIAGQASGVTVLPTIPHPIGGGVSVVRAPRVDAVANGMILIASVRLFPGFARGVSVVQLDQRASPVSVHPVVGQVLGEMTHGRASGGRLTLAASVVSGEATGGAIASGDVVHDFMVIEEDELWLLTA